MVVQDAVVGVEAKKGEVARGFGGVEFVYGDAGFPGGFCVGFLFAAGRTEEAAGGAVDKRDSCITFQAGPLLIVYDLHQAHVPNVYVSCTGNPGVSVRTSSVVAEREAFDEAQVFAPEARQVVECGQAVDACANDKGVVRCVHACFLYCLFRACNEVTGTVFEIVCVVDGLDFVFCTAEQEFEFCIPFVQVHGADDGNQLAVWQVADPDVDAITVAGGGAIQVSIIVRVNVVWKPGMG